jgi:hypothetical protein
MLVPGCIDSAQLRHAAAAACRWHVSALAPAQTRALRQTSYALGQTLGLHKLP